MLEKLSAGSKPEGGKKRYRRESGYVGEQTRDHGEREARRIIRSGLRLAKIGSGELKSLPKADWRKRVIGLMVRRHAMVKVGWVAEELRMGIPTRAGRLTSHPPAREKWGSDVVECGV